jgi:iron complex outermembrane recepter protein
VEIASTDDPYRFDLSFGGNCDGLNTTQNICRYYYYARPDGKNKATQANFDLIGTLGQGSITHNLLISADTNTGKKTGELIFSELAPVNLSAPNKNLASSIDNSLVLASLNYIDMNNWQGVSVQDHIDFGNGFNLLLALRHDRSKASYNSAPNTVTFTSPRIGLVYAPQRNHSFYAQYQESLAANNGRDLDLNQTPLKPETAKQTEFGYKYTKPDDSLTFTTSIYELTKLNRADFSLYPIKIQTIGEAVSRGLEFDLLGKITNKLSLICSLALSDTEVTKDPRYQGKALANAPDQSASLWVSYEISKDWRLGGGAFYQGDRFGDVDNSFVLPAYTRLDGMIAYDFEVMQSRSSLQLTINNLTDERFYTGAHQFVSDWVQPGAPRTISLTLRVSY